MHFDEKTHLKTVNDAKLQKIEDKQLKKILKPYVRPNTLKVKNLVARYHVEKKQNDDKREWDRLMRKVSLERKSWQKKMQGEQLKRGEKKYSDISYVGTEHASEVSRMRSTSSIQNRAPTSPKIGMITETTPTMKEKHLLQAELIKNRTSL